MIEEVALLKHRDPGDEAKPYLALLQTPERTFIAQSGLLGEGMPNHRTRIRSRCRARASFRPGADTLELKLQATAANGDKVVQVLTFHRGSYVIDVTYDVTNASERAGRTVRVFPARRATRRRRARTTRWRRRPTRARSSTTRPTSSRRSISASSTSSPPTRRRKLPYTKNADNGWVGMVEHYFVVAWLPSDEKKIPREFYARKLDGDLCRGRRRAGGDHRAGRDRRRSTCRSTSARRNRMRWRSSPRDSTSSSTTASSPSLRRRSSGCSSGCTASSATGAGRSSR